MTNGLRLTFTMYMITFLVFTAVSALSGEIVTVILSLIGAVVSIGLSRMLEVMTKILDAINLSQHDDVTSE